MNVAEIEELQKKLKEAIRSKNEIEAKLRDAGAYAKVTAGHFSTDYVVRTNYKEGYRKAWFALRYNTHLPRGNNFGFTSINQFDTFEQMLDHIRALAKDIAELASALETKKETAQKAGIMNDYETGIENF